MTAPTHRRPVRPVPEQRHVPFVRDDVVGDCRPAQAAELQALGAEGILMKELPRRLAPFVSVSPWPRRSGGCGRAPAFPPAGARGSAFHV